MTHDFTTIYNQHYTEILRYCIRESRDRDTGADLAQETFLRFWQCATQNREILNVRAFLYRIAHNLFVTQTRRKKEGSLDQLLETGFEPSIDPWHQTESRLDAAKLFRKLAAMPQPYRQAVHSRFVMGLLPAQIAQITGDTPNNVSVHISRGLKYLQSQLHVAAHPLVRCS